MRKILMMAICGIFALGLAVGSVQAKNKTAKRIAIGLGIAALTAAAISSANAHHDREYYDYNHGIGGRQNAIAACVHRAHRIVHKTPGGLRVRLNKVRRVKRTGRDKFRVVADMTGIYTYGRKRSRVRCVVKHDRVVKFKFR